MSALPASSADVHAAVFSVVSEYSRFDVLSTAIALREVRMRCGQTPLTDEQIVGMIVHAATGQATPAISFDHRAEIEVRKVA